MMKWSNYFFNLVDVIKQKSKDTSVQVGCVIVGKNHEVISTGFNGFPIGVDDAPGCELKGSRYDRPLKYFYTEHAERNAIYLAARRGVSLDDSTIFLQWYPCADCARAIIQSGIRSVWIDGSKYNPDTPTEADKRWEDSFKAAKIMFEEAGVMVFIDKET